MPRLNPIPAPAASPAGIDPRGLTTHRHRMLPRRTALALGATALATPWLIRPAKAAATNWVFYSTQPRGSVGAGVWQSFTDAVRTATSGALDITLITAGRIGIDANAITPAITAGSIAMGDDSFYAQTIIPGGIPRLPLLVPDRASFQRGAKAMKTYLGPVYDARNAVLLGYTFTPRLRTWGRVRFDSFAGLASRRIRAISAEQGEFIRRLGAIPVTLPAATVGRALEKGEMDAVFAFANGGASAWRKSLVAAYAGGPHHFDAVLIANKPAFQALPSSLRDILVQEVARAEAAYIDALYSAEDAALAKLAADGLELAEQQTDDIRIVADKMALMWNDWTRVRGAECQDLLLAFRRAMEAT